MRLTNSGEITHNLVNIESPTLAQKVNAFAQFLYSEKQGNNP